MLEAGASPSPAFCSNTVNESFLTMIIGVYQLLPLYINNKNIQ